MLSAPLPPGFLTTLETIDTALAPFDILWALTGSAGFALQGMKLPVKDIDLQTDKAGAYATEEVLAYEQMGRLERVGTLRHFLSLRHGATR